MSERVAITLDVEGDFGTSELRGVDEALPELLDGFAEREVRAVLFVVGEVARQRGSMLRRAAEAGHAIGSHGLTHRPFSKLTGDERRRELAESKALVEAATGQPCVAFRAPFFDAPDDLGRLLDETGYRWSSSKAPFSPLSRYRWLSAREPHRWAGARTVELPVSRLLGLPMPEGLSYRRLFWPLTALATRPPSMFYLHPYELLDEVSAFGHSRAWKMLMTVRQGAWARRELWRLVDQWRQAGATFAPPDDEALACVT